MIQREILKHILTYVSWLSFEPARPLFLISDPDRGTVFKSELSHAPGKCAQDGGENVECFREAKLLRPIAGRTDHPLTEGFRRRRN
jgi:hypothetical protein